MPDDLSQSQSADVLRRAALLQARSDDTGVGLSLDELKHAAEAADIKGRFVEQAYLSTGDGQPLPEPFLGIQTGVRRTRAIAGPVSELEWGQIVLALRREFGDDGHAETLGDVRAWKAGQTRAELEPDGADARVTLSGEWTDDVKTPLYISAMSVVFGALLVVAGVASSDMTPVWIAAAILAISLVQVGVVWGPVRKRAATRGLQFDRVLEGVARLAGSDERAAALEDSPRAQAPESDSKSALPHLNSALLDDLEPDAPAPASAGRTRLRG